jgi:hypothetical protein
MRWPKWPPFGSTMVKRSKVDLYYVKNLKVRYSIAKQDLRIQKLQKLAKNNKNFLTRVDSRLEHP